jgi:hypothetical protein
MCGELGGFGECAQRELFKGVVKRQVDKITRRMKEKNRKREVDQTSPTPEKQARQ